MTRTGEVEDGFESFFVEIYPQAKHLAYRIVRTKAGAEDVAAEALARAYVHWRSLAQHSHREAWVLRVSSNLAIDAVRKRPRWLPGRRLADPEELAADRLVLADALAKLPRRQREVLTLRYLLDMSEGDVASTIGIAVGTVKATSAHGLAAMRGVLGTDDGTTREFPASQKPLRRS